MADEHNCVSRLDFNRREGSSAGIDRRQQGHVHNGWKSDHPKWRISVLKMHGDLYQLTSACDQWSKESVTQKDAETQGPEFTYH